jgi:protein TonB
MGLEGRVILEAIVDEEGRVIEVKVLRSAGVFDKAALAAVRQWRYSPVLLNGNPVKFILTVVVSFSLQR